MANYPPDQICSPPELPAYLKSVCDLKPIVGAPKDEEVIGIHAVMRIAHKFVDAPDVCDPGLLVRLSGHLFDVQMATYRSRYPCSIFETNTTYTPPVLPAYAPPVLEPVSGTPSDEQVAKVLGAIHSYQRFADIPTMFDPQLHAGLSQHLFDIQMERYIRRGPTAVSSVPQETTRVGCSGFAPTNEQADVQIHTETNNAGTGADAVRSHGYSRAGEDAGICEAMERSNRLAEHANQLLEQSNLLVERSNRLAERSNQLAEQSSEPSQQPKQPVERSSHHSMDPLKECTGSSNRHIEKSRGPPTTIADASVTSTHHNDFIRAEPALDTPLKRKVETSAARKITTSDFVFRECLNGHSCFGTMYDFCEECGVGLEHSW